jgi:hypothetical protein
MEVNLFCLFGVLWNNNKKKMDGNEIVATVLSVIGALGGLELIKWWFTRKENRRTADAKADIAEVEAETAESVCFASTWRWWISSSSRRRRVCNNRRSWCVS